jgi:hypothetical protein
MNNNAFFRILLLIALAISTAGSQAQNNSLAFDGIDDAVTVSGASNLITTGTGLTLTTWVYPTNAAPSFPNFDGIAGIRNNIDADFYMLHFTATSVEARFRNGAGVNYDIVAPVLTLNTWVHLALTYDGTTLSLYKNGVLNTSVPASGNISNSTVDFLIGNLLYNNTNYYLSGKVDEVSFWNRALQPSELACIASNGIDTTTATGLKLYYKCNQGVAGGNNTTQSALLNSAAAGNNGILTGFSLNGNASNFVAGAVAITTVTQFICPDSVLVFNGQPVTAPGTYYDTLTTAAGCDSIIQLNLFSLTVNTGVTQNGSSLTANHTGTYYQWLDCNNNFAPIPGANAKTFNPTVPGSYAVIVLQGACYDTSSCYTVSAIGVGELNPTLFTVYPTITSGSVTIRADQTLEPFILYVNDLSGRRMMEENLGRFGQYTLDISHLPQGYYTLELRGENQGAAYRILKQ